MKIIGVDVGASCYSSVSMFHEKKMSAHRKQGIGRKLEVIRILGTFGNYICLPTNFFQGNPSS